MSANLKSPQNAYFSDLLRQYDSDRWLCTLCAPREKIESLFILFTVYFEISKTRSVVKDEMAGAIRLQWWQEEISKIYQNNPTPHEIITPLAGIIQQHDLPQDLWQKIITARHDDLNQETPENFEEFLSYMRHTAMIINQLAAKILNTEPVDGAGMIWGMTGLLRAVPYYAQYNKVFLPKDLLKKHHIDRRAVVDNNAGDPLRHLVIELTNTVKNWIAQSRADHHLTPENRAILFQISLAESYIHQIEKSDYDLWHPRVQSPAPYRALKLNWYKWKKKF